MIDKECKVFGDWVEVDCNECARYWDSSCDATKTLAKGSKTPCNSFLATRSVVIPQKLKRLEKALKRQRIALVVLGVLEIIHILVYVLGEII